MKIGVGYSDNPDSREAGRQAAQAALAEAGGPCDLALLFGTERHNQAALREGVAAVTGASVPVYGGGAAGIITNREFGYAGDQAGVVFFRMEGTVCTALAEGGLAESEEDTGLRLGRRLAETGVKPESPLLLFYDAVDRSSGGVRLLMATWLLAGLEKGLGFFPALAGAGIQSDHIASSSKQFVGDRIDGQQAIALAFSEDIRMDSVILHGCRPASQYYTVTKAEGPVILEINGEPALLFMDKLLGPAVRPEEYPFFLLFGINHGERWGEYDENNYASRLCLNIDTQRNGIVMFEPDMCAGTEFQLMLRSLDLDYMRPKIENAFSSLDGREPLFALYIDCAGRCAGYSGVDVEDARELQKIVDGRVPLFGLYTGVEIASIGGRPRGLDWTGVFCLFSQNKNAEPGGVSRGQVPVWENAAAGNTSKAVPLEAALRLSERNAAKALALEAQSIAIRHELEQKRRGFSLLAELSVSLRQAVGYESVFIPVAQRINAALNMQRTAILVRRPDGLYTPSVLQGYTAEEKAELAGRRIKAGAEMLDPERPVRVTAEDSPETFADIRAALKLPFFISRPVIVLGQAAAILVTGRVTEAPPFLSRLGRGDTENVQAIGALLASVLVRQRLDATEERTRIMLNALPLSCVFWDENGEPADCNAEALRLFGFADKKEFLDSFYRLAPETQPGGNRSVQTARNYVLHAFISGFLRFEWVHLTAGGEITPAEVTLIRVPHGEGYTLTGYIRDLREQKTAMAEMRKARNLAEQSERARTEFLASVTHEVRTPMNAITAMARAAMEMTADKNTKQVFEQGIRSARLLGAVIDNILDFSRIESGQITLAASLFSVRETINGIAGMLFEEAAEKSLALRVEYLPDVPEFVIGDSARLEQAVFNIAANAVKFTKKGDVLIRVRREDSRLPAKVRLLFEVRDTGPGMTDEAVTKAFQPLGAGISRRRESGMGMGLAVSRSIAQLMEGGLSCESKAGKGSVFTLSVILGMPASSPPEARPKESVLKDLAGLRVLAADDNAINQMIIQDILNAADIEVTTAANGLEVLETLENKAFDIVLMDIQMPEMDGLTAAARIRARPRHDGMPILAMTANSAAEHRQQSLKAGMNDHLTKPLDVDAVYAALKRWDPRRRPNPENREINL